MTPRRLLLALMWSSALAAIVYLGWGREEAGESASSADPAASELIPAPGGGRAAIVGPAPPTEGSSFRMGSLHPGRSLAVGPEVGELRWHFEAGGPIVGQAAVDGAGRIVVGDLSGSLYCLDSAGTLLWERALGGSIYASPLLDAEGNVYVGSDADAFWSFDARGERRFRIITRGDADSAPTLAPDGTLRFAAGDELWAITREGDVLWRWQAEDKIFSSPAVDGDGNSYVGSQDDHVHAIDAAGQLLWSFATGGDVDSSPAVGQEGNVYVGSDDGSVYALSSAGDLLARASLGGRVRAPVAIVGDGTIVVSVSGERPRVVALDATSLSELWSFVLGTIGDDEVGVRSGPLVDAEGSVYFGGPDHFVYSTGADGRLRWTLRALGAVDGGPVITPSGVLLIGSRDGRLHAIGSPSGD